MTATSISTHQQRSRKSHQLFILVGTLLSIVIVAVVTTTVLKSKKANTSLRAAHSSSVLSQQEQQEQQQGRSEDLLLTSSSTAVPDGLFGTLSALAIKIVTPDAVESVSQEFLSNKLFGNGADGTVMPMSFSGHFATCSHGQLNFIPAEDRDGNNGIQIRNGATTVTVSTNSTNGKDAVYQAVAMELTAQFGVSHPNELANELLFFMPSGAMGHAEASPLSHQSFYNIEGWYDPHHTMHEVGHSLNMGHSGDNGDAYGDESCIMGRGLNNDQNFGAPICFNAAKSWQLGWFAPRNHVYNVREDGVWSGRLIGTVDYSNEYDLTSTVILKLNTPLSTDFYVMFNRVTSGSVESENLVLVSAAPNENVGFTESSLIAKLGSGQSATLPSYYKLDALELMVNAIDLNANPAYADVTVRMKCHVDCGAILETWSGIEGSTINDLLDDTNNMANPPTTTKVLDQLLEGPTNSDDNYGSRMKGWLVPPVTGDYEFWIASDDEGELWLSTNVDPANRNLICRQPMFSGPNGWDDFQEQKSQLISLVAGNAYYFEALMKEGDGGDNLAIAWQYPGQTRTTIPAEFSRVSNPLQSGAMLETWAGIGGSSIADLLSGTNNFTNEPSRVDVLWSVLEGPTNVDDNYGSRIKGWLVPPVTGEYEFWIASDDEGEFWLSMDADPANKVRECRSWPSQPRWWDAFFEQKSRFISLVAGQAYYYEAIMKEGGGDDFLAIAWQYPGQTRDVIPAMYSRVSMPF